ncbi:ABC transporter substrate-binding protein [Streptomyces sp. B-S-A8]|uniref:ABC transporter substrate-binding protein n=1 Tax=Streptomyces solicavernae TaxID=3043614 RepID=A0ABT6RV56_9ACTN|nr:ABC transporter substrate-binding protein [Streptomyces sp. B-S-A8]MDI3388326.1 ABC transporter substrate-binding protein [Streptomyces sp. B-S-A8]
MTDPQHSPSTGPWPVPGRPRTKRWYVLWGGAATLLVAAVVYFLAADTWGTRAYLFDRCAEGVWEQGPDDECVGVTDGAYSFDDSLDAVTRAIHEENQRVEKTGKPWVAVAYVHPLTAGGSGLADNSARQELEGARLAQYALNRHEVGGHGDVPQIKLLLGNPGARGQQHEKLVGQLAEMQDDEEHRLVAVTGFGPSYATTKKIIEELRSLGLPLVGGTSTADNLTDGDQVGFFRVSNPNRSEAAAAARHLKDLQDKNDGFRVDVIEDRSGEEVDTGNELYSTSLYRGFADAAEKQGLKLERLGLDYSSNAPATATAFSSIAERVCREKLDALYFAGRGKELRQFITAMSAFGQRCPVTVFTGDDAVGMYADGQEGDEARKRFTDAWERSGVTVRYTALAHPDLWRDGYPGGRADPMPEFAERYEKLTGRGRGDLDDGQAIAVHDAVLVAGTAVRDAWPAKTERYSGAVRQMLLQVKEGNEVAGLSGLIRFDDAGNPDDKVLPIVELRPSGGQFVFREGVEP